MAASSGSLWKGLHGAAPFAFSLYLKGFPRAHGPPTFSILTNVHHFSWSSPTCHLPIPVISCSSSAAAPSRLPLTVWAGLSFPGRTCSWAGPDTPTSQISGHPSQLLHSPNPTESKRRKALTTDTFTNRSEKQVLKAGENPALTPVS